MIAILDYEMGNIASIRNMLKKLGHDSILTAKPAEIESASSLILPGVGAFDSGMTNLAERGLISLIKKRAVEDKIPILGICLGMQLLASGSEEGRLKGLELIPARVKKFSPSAERKVPHMGWNKVKTSQTNPLFSETENDPRFYFVHSYYFDCQNEKDIIGTTEYGEVFTSAVCRNNIYGVQFHPEKSHKFGLSLLANFAHLH